MDFELSESQTELAGLTRQILTDQVTPQRLRAVEEQGLLYDEALWKALAERDAELAKRTGVKPHLGMRAKLATVSGAPFQSTLMCASLFHVFATKATKHRDAPPDGACRCF